MSKAPTILEQFPDQYKPIAEHAREIGCQPDEVVEAVAPTRRDDEFAVLNVNGVEYKSYRFQIAPGSDDRSRGGLELSDKVTADKVLGKAIGMHWKHMLYPTGNVGGKSGIHITREQLENLSLADREELIRQHAEAHNYDPQHNVTATDIATDSPDMDIIAQALWPKFHDLAGAVASGVSTRYGGRPDLHTERTGLGVAIDSDQYCRERARYDRTLQRIIEQAGTLTVKTQADGKAGRSFNDNLPHYFGLKAIAERNGALVATKGNFVNRSEHTATASQRQEILKRTEYFDPAYAHKLGIPGMALVTLDEFWDMQVDIVAAAFDKYEITTERLRKSGAFVVASAANEPVTPEAEVYANTEHIDITPYMLMNAGGTLSSQLIWESIVHPEGWTDEAYKQEWTQVMVSTARRIFAKTFALRAEHPERFVPLQRTVDEIVIKNAVEHARKAA